jgi:hypothetical protein
MIPPANKFRYCSSMRSPISEKLHDAPDTMSGVLDHAFELYGRSFLRIAPYVLLSALPNAVLGVVLGSAQQSMGQLIASGAISQLFSRYFWMIPLAIAVFWFAAICYGAAHYRLGCIARGADCGFKAALKLAYQRGWRLFFIALMGLVFLMGAMMVGGVWAALCIGIFFAAALAAGDVSPVLSAIVFVVAMLPGILLVAFLIVPTLLAPCGAMLQNLSFGEALSAAFRLQTRHFWRATLMITVPFAVYTVCYSFAAGLMFVLMFFNIQANGADSLGNHLITQAITVPLMALLMPMISACTVALYWDLLMRREGYDLETRMTNLRQARALKTSSQQSSALNASPLKTSPLKTTPLKTTAVAILLTMSSATFASPCPDPQQTIATACPELYADLQSKPWLQAGIDVDTPAEPALIAQLEQLRSWPGALARAANDVDLGELMSKHYTPRKPEPPGFLQRLVEWWESLFDTSDVTGGDWSFLKRWLPTELVVRVLFFAMSGLLIAFVMVYGWREFRRYYQPSVRIPTKATEWPPRLEGLTPAAQISTLFSAFVNVLSERNRLRARAFHTHHELIELAQQPQFDRLAHSAALVLFAPNTPTIDPQHYLQACQDFLGPAVKTDVGATHA